ncbi:glutamate---tRNA ligase [Synchytrium endobioticum]|uniref:Probable glutamate--tRNA ligase, cytoplasmic n=1 Tax=Synchytrium endobioticum TaxID=286115 RepID=A0A507CYH9_9FUNG|nr:glutamate---tRNA ligase [Synchytrium endobioticum]TPX44214.1 glutamate---tRNA ligase [Synchytrium endobioticum]
MSVIKVVFSTKTSPTPYAPLATALHLKPSVAVSFDQHEGRDASVVIPLSDSRPAEITGTIPVLRALGRFVESHQHLYGNNAIRATEIDYWIDFARDTLSSTAFNDMTSALEELNHHLKLRSFIVGYHLTLADYAVWGALKSSTVYLGLFKGNKVGPYLTRWYEHVSSVPAVAQALVSLEKAKSGKSSKLGQQGNLDLDLIGAEEGNVVTRFPPEPSGYLHIGHAKAALLNQYYAQKYQGQMILRFDDTNPSKEKEEYEESIKEDLRLIDIYPDKVTHTSDYFDLTYEYAIKIIQMGKAFVDDTDQETMKEERTAMKNSKCRNLSVEENLKRFEEMRQATELGLKCCLRAKINMQDANGTLRDPVIYRCNLEPHHRTGTKYKMYPTYDFVCPIIDSIEGVTHALRDKAYRDRNVQYEWFLKTLNLRWVYTRDFSRINFVYSLMSKRKLAWFVAQGKVSGWDDPRFPTIRGIRRRGLTIEALRRYILTQGASQKDMLLEWDKIWTENKRVIDPVAPRHTAIDKDNIVTVLVKGDGAPEQPYSKDMPKHKKNPDVGVKQTVFSKTIYLEQVDAELMETGEEVTLMDWGNAVVTAIAHKPDKKTIDSICLKLHLEGDFKKTKKKLTWLSTVESSAGGDGPVNIVLHDYDYLITKKKLEEDEDMNDFLTPTTEFTTDCVGDSNLKSLKKGEIIQFERKGYYVCDATYNPDIVDAAMHFILIPDGSDKTTASKADIS